MKAIDIINSYDIAFTEFHLQSDDLNFTEAMIAWCDMMDEALAMNRFISAGKLTIPSDAPDYDFCVTARASWMARRKPIRDAACGYGNAFVEFHHASDFDTFTGVCVAWLNMMDEALCELNHSNA